MSILSEDGRRVLSDVAQRHGLSTGAAEHLLMAIVAGHTTQAQFNHPELGGMGQWSQGGMIMVGDMFNNGLKARVDAICSELAGLARSMDMLRPMQSYAAQSQMQGDGTSLFVASAFSSSNGWPEALGQPSSTGSQNNLRYAFFPATRRLAIDRDGQTTVYDTQDHQIGGFSQQQSGDQSLSFTSQYGLVRLSDLNIVSSDGAQAGNTSGAISRDDVAPQFSSASDPVRIGTDAQQPWQPSGAEDDIFGKIERLAALHGRGILTDQEFQAKKSELLDRL